LTVLWTAKTLYPALFVDLDLAAEVKAFYRDFFGHDLTDAQIAVILSGTL
jgi:iron complex transport system substrate-binding protein